MQMSKVPIISGYDVVTFGTKRRRSLGNVCKHRSMEHSGVKCFHCTHVLDLRPNKEICVFTVTYKKNVGSDSINFFLLLAKPEIVVSDSGISFSKFPVSPHLLKLFYDELRSFSTFIALNFDKKLAVE
jgi:hypothetical protein